MYEETAVEDIVVPPVEMPSLPQPMPMENAQYEEPDQATSDDSVIQDWDFPAEDVVSDSVVSDVVDLAIQEPVDISDPVTEIPDPVAEVTFFDDRPNEIETDINVVDSRPSEDILMATPQRDMLASDIEMVQQVEARQNDDFTEAGPIVSNEFDPSDSVSDQPTEFFDSESLVPAGQMGDRVGPRPVDPTLNPASKMVVVTQNYTQNSRQSAIVAAQRAIDLGRYEAALALYEDLYRKTPRDPAILMGRAISYQKLGRDELAIQTYEELLDIKPRNLEARINFLGVLSQKFPSVALQNLMDLKSDYPSNVGINAQIASAYASLGDYENAARFYQVAMTMQPENPAHFYNLAIVMDRAGMAKEAIGYYEQALKTDAVYGSEGSLDREIVYDRLSILRRR